MPLNTPAARAAYFAGVRDTLTIVPSYLPFALVCGVASVNAGLTTGASLAMPALVFGGSSQAVMTQFIQNSASLWVAVLSGLVINLRMAVYSAALAPKLRALSTWQRMACAFFLVDNTYAFVQKRADALPGDKHLVAYYAGLSSMVWPFWVLFCAIGIFAGTIVPGSWQLDFAIPLSFIAVIATSIRSLPMGASALVGGAASILLFSLPLKLGLIAACVLGLLGGLIVERISQKFIGDTMEEGPLP
jgi:predicted branched-subunit amino acid permease